ncbi:MAG: NADH-quinone oxidoreductase subunit J [Flavobacteriales bacterium]|nr:NADH-quinone oxidoreductase subunit J [Flavobacteriales bacterium]
MLALFYLFAAISVISALIVVSARNPINSVIALIVCFLSIAGHYILLNAQFLAMVHVIVYTGAIMVLFLFVIMLLNLNKATEPMKSLGMRVAAITGGGLLFITLAAAIRHGVSIQSANPFDAGIGLVRSVGHVLFTEFLLPFEVSSVLFLSAIVGVVMLAKKEKHQPNASVEPLTEAERARRTA